MLKSTELIMDHKLDKHIIRDSDLAKLFGGSPARRYGLVNKAIQKGELIRLARGFYTLNNKYLTHPLTTAYIANRLVPNSFVTAESALSFHGWIPERVTQTISINAFGRKKSFDTPMGEFLYYKTPVEKKHFFYGVELQENFAHTIYMASPLRALMDFVYLHKPKSANTDFLTGSLRIEEEHIAGIKADEIKALMPVYKSTPVKQFLNDLLKGLCHEQPHH